MHELDKIALRKALRQQRAQLTREQVTAAGEAVARQILACDAFRKAKSIMGFLAFGKELSVDLVLEQALAMGKTVAVPHIESATSFVPVRLKNLQDFDLDRYGIRTVRPPLELIEPNAFDLVLVPGVAYDCLLHESLPCDEHDVKMQLLVSESGILTLSPL